MASYSAPYAELYDHIYAGKPYAAEAAFLDGKIRARLGLGRLRLLELACGTGNHSFQFEQRGYAVTATDLSPGMIGVARAKAQARGSTVEFRVADMAHAAASDASYDVVVCLFDSLGYLLSNERILECLRHVHRHLRPGGLCVIESWHAAAMLSHRDAVRVRRWTQDESNVVRVAETVCDHVAQVCTVNYDVVVLRAGHTWERFQETHRNRYFSKQELDLLLQVAQLDVLDCFCDYAANKPIDADAWHLLHVAERRA